MQLKPNQIYKDVAEGKSEYANYFAHLMKAFLEHRDPQLWGGVNGIMQGAYEYVEANRYYAHQIVIENLKEALGQPTLEDMKTNLEDWLKMYEEYYELLEREVSKQQEEKSDAPTA